MTLKARLNSTAHHLNQIAALSGDPRKIAISNLKQAHEQGIINYAQKKVLWHALMGAKDRTVESVDESLMGFLKLSKNGAPEGSSPATFWLLGKLDTLRTADFDSKPQTPRPLTAAPELNPGAMQQAFAAAQAQNPLWEPASFQNGMVGNTGITGGIAGINNGVPRGEFFGNTGITGGIDGINNGVPLAQLNRTVLAVKQASLQVREDDLNRAAAHGVRGAALELKTVQRELAGVRRDLLTSPIAAT